MEDRRGGSGSDRADYRLGRLKGRWVVMWEEGGRRHRWRLVGATSAVEARAALRDFARERDALARPRRVTVEDLWNSYIAEKIAEGKVSTSRMADAWKALRPAFSDLSPQEANAETVRRYVDVRRKTGVGDGTLLTELGYLRASLRHAGHAATFKLPPKPRPKSRYLTPDEARRLIDASAMPHLLLFIRLALHTAGRPSSILDLTWDRVDFRNRRIALDNPHRDRTAKGRATVPMADVLIGLLEDARAAAITNHVIEWAGKPVKSIKKGIRQAARRAGIVGVTPYVLRHTAAVWLAESGVPMEEIAQYLGHTNPSVTFRVYARYSPDYLQKAASAISRRLA